MRLKPCRKRRDGQRPSDGGALAGVGVLNEDRPKNSIQPDTLHKKQRVGVKVYGRLETNGL